MMRTLLSQVLHRHLALLPEQPAPEASAAEESAFRAQCRARLDHHCRVIALTVLAFALLWWPTDALVYRDLPDVLPAVRLWRVLIAVACAVYLVAPHPGPLRRRPLVLFVLGVTFSCAVMGYTAGLMGSPDRPYLHLLYVLCVGTVLLPLRLGPRIAVNLTYAVATLVGYFVPFPGYLASPHVPLVLSFSVCVLGLSVIIGHLLFMLSRENFLQALRIRHQAAALADHSARLEERVAARTAELRRLLAHLESAREDERARVSRELHDELGQELSALRFALRLTRGRYHQDPGGLAPNLAELEMLVGRTSTSARQLITDLRPRILDDLGLAAAAEWLVRRAEQRTGVPCRLTVEAGAGRDGAEAKGAAATVAFRVLQESLTNVERHAAARAVSVALSLGALALELSVRDDGVGFSPARPGGGVGLIGMRERALAAGGSLSVDSRPGAGTCVRLRLPLPAAAAPAAEAAS